MAIQTWTLSQVDAAGALLVLRYDDVTMQPDSIEISGTRAGDITFTLLDYVTEAPLWTRTYRPGDGVLQLPGNVRTDPNARVRFVQRTRPGDGAVVTVLDGPKYRVDSLVSAQAGKT